MRFLQTLADTLSKLAMFLAAIILVYAIGHILLETVLRSVFATSIYVLDEFIGFAIMSITFLSLAWTLKSDAMIRVTLLSDMLPNRVFRVLKCVVSMVGGVLVSCLCVFLFRNMVKDWDRGAVSASIAEVPLWIPGLIAFIGACLLAAQLLLRAIAVFAGGLDRGAEHSEAL